ncbi:MAG: hypothetical protein GEU94_01245 [Micromonosporaceae bacterium]|nr:hypothetical protein [Micromonosporaceae bacterium]
MVIKPRGVFDRDQEWSDLGRFLQAPGPGMRLGVVYGRRRQGKSFLLRRLVEATGGLYFMAVQEERRLALERFAAAAARGLFGLPAGSMTFDSWDAALRGVLTAMPQAARLAGTPPVLVIDELPHVLGHSPELPSVLQLLYDESRDDSAAPPVRVIVCGSALAVMSELLSGAKALRGRAMLDMCLQPFSFSDAGAFWGVSDPDLAFHLNAVLGGTPGYKDLIAEPPPGSVAELGGWLAHSVLDPSHALFDETDYLLREDPRITDRALYQSVLTAISRGATTPSKIGAIVGRPAQALAHPLAVLEKAGFVNRVEDVLLHRRAQLRLADPIVRFQQAISRPRIAMLEERRAAEVWRASANTFASGVLGPHFEHLARAWCASRAATEFFGEQFGPVGPTVINDARGHARHELDVVALADGELARSQGAVVRLLGEVKHSQQPRTVRDLERLDHIRRVLLERGVRADRAHLVIFARRGADAQLRAACDDRADAALVDLSTMYAP